MYKHEVRYTFRAKSGNSWHKNSHNPTPFLLFTFALVRTLNTEDTIVALSTPPGAGAIAVIRLSGPAAVEIVSKNFRSVRKHFNLTKAKTHTVHFGSLVLNEQIIDEVLVTVMYAPKTYTGQTIVEISCHGSPYIQKRILDLMQQNGCRLAEPGEYTMRAFLNGKMDLSQAEAVADLIASDSATTHELALKQMRGGFRMR